MSTARERSLNGGSKHLAAALPGVALERRGTDAYSSDHLGERRTAVLLDPQPLWLVGVRTVLEAIGVEVVASATTADHALALLQQHVPDLLIADVETTGGTAEGVAFFAQVCREVPNLRVIVLSGAECRDVMAASFQAGARVYLLKSADLHDVASAVRQVFSPSMHLPPDAERAPTAATREGLTARELEILQLAAQGYSNGELARKLWIAEPTVKFHLSNVYRKVNVANRTEAARWAERHGLLDQLTDPA